MHLQHVRVSGTGGCVKTCCRWLACVGFSMTVGLLWSRAQGAMRRRRVSRSLIRARWPATRETRLRRLNRRMLSTPQVWRTVRLTVLVSQSRRRTMCRVLRPGRATRPKRTPQPSTTPEAEEDASAQHAVEVTTLPESDKDSRCEVGAPDSPPSTSDAPPEPVSVAEGEVLAPRSR